MQEQLNSELREFILSFCKRQNISNIDIDDLSLDTSLDLDLNIFDIDIDLFLSDFVRKFEIDISDFEWGKQLIYPDEGDMGLLYCFFRSFDFRKEWVKRQCKKYYKPKVFVRSFQSAIDYKSFI